jgi:hypothetical protein
VSFYKSYPNRKDWRKPRHGGDATCYNHGSCPWCAAGRKHRQRRQEPLVEADSVVVMKTEFVSDW